MKIKMKKAESSPGGREVLQREKSDEYPSPESKAQLLFLGLLSISFVGYFALRELWIGIVFGHIAALCIMGFYGCLGGAIARARGYSYRTAFLIGFFIPIVLGAISAFLLPAGPRNLPLTCGGWTSLATGAVVVLVYAFLKKK